MAVPVTSAGGLFTRLGHFLGGLYDINALRGGTATTRVLAAANWPINRVAQIQTDYAATPPDQIIINGLYTNIAAFQSAQGSFLRQIQQFCQNTLTYMVNADTPLPQPTIANAMRVLISQMQLAGSSVFESTVNAGVQTTVGTPNGNPVILASVKGPTGLFQEYMFAETLNFTCSQDSQSGAILGQEQFSIVGPASISNTLDPSWPGGSGVNASLRAVNAATNNSGGNLLTNSDFETFTVTNVPDNWTIVVGTPGATVFKGSAGNSYYGSACLQITGNGSENTSLTQTLTNIQPLTQYGVNLFIKMSGVPIAGILTIDLIDGSNAVINDAQGAPNSFQKVLTGATTGYLPLNGTFRLPSVMPATVKIRIRLSTALENTRSLFIDHLALNPMSLLYAGGPMVSIFSGNVKLILGDAWTIAMTNVYGGWQKAFEQIFGMRQLGLQLPSSGSPTISDSLIV